MVSKLVFILYILQIYLFSQYQILAPITKKGYDQGVKCVAIIFPKKINLNWSVNVFCYDKGQIKYIKMWKVVYNNLKVLESNRIRLKVKYKNLPTQLIGIIECLFKANIYIE